MVINMNDDKNNKNNVRKGKEIGRFVTGYFFFFHKTFRFVVLKLHKVTETHQSCK